MSPNLDLKLGIKPKAGNFLSGKREGEGGRETEVGRQIDKERFKTERGRQKSKSDEDLVKRCDIANMHYREREGGKRGQNPLDPTWEFLFFKEGWREIWVRLAQVRLGLCV